MAPRDTSIPPRATKNAEQELRQAAQQQNHFLKEAELALRESEARFRDIAEKIREVFWVTDPAKTRMLYVSPAYEEIWGRTCASLYENPMSFVEAIHPMTGRASSPGWPARRAASTTRCTGS